MVADVRLGVSTRWWLAALAAMACGLVIWSLAATSAVRSPSFGAAAQSQSASDRFAPAASNRSASWSSIPLAAQSAISTALGADNAAYRLRGLTAENPAQGLHVEFSAAGAAISAHGQTVTVSFARLGRADRLTTATGATALPRRTGQRIVFEYPGMLESWSNGPLGPEQSFTVRSRPSGSGALTLAVAVAGASVHLTGPQSAILSGTTGVRLHYDGLIATDASGRTLRSWLTGRGSQLMIHVDDHDARYPLQIDPYVQQKVLTNAGGGAEDDFGYSVAIAGNTIVVGAPSHAVAGNPGEGAAYVFTKPVSGWKHAKQVAELTAADGIARDLFGVSVAISGNTIVVGAQAHAVSGKFDQGDAYVFVKPSSGWRTMSQTAELTSADGGAGDGFGHTVAVSGNTIVVCAPGHAVSGRVLQGAAYLFTKPSTGWVDATQTAELTNADGVAGDGFGYSVAVSGKAVVIGAYEQPIAGRDGQGAAYVYTQPASGWVDATPTAELTSSDGAGGDHFGGSVAISGNTIVVGAENHTVAGKPSEGAAYVFTEPSSGWRNMTETAQLTKTGGAEGDDFGVAVAISGNTIVVDAENHFRSTRPNLRSAVYVFIEPSSGWRKTGSSARLTGPRGTMGNDFFGSALAISGNTIVAAAILRRTGSRTSRGVAYVFTKSARRAR